MTVGASRQKLVDAAGTDPTAKRKAKTVIGYLHDDTFWRTLKRANNHLRPLALANMILQRDDLRLDQTWVIFGCLYKYYSRSTQTEPIDIVRIQQSFANYNLHMY